MLITQSSHNNWYRNGGPVSHVRVSFDKTGVSFVVRVVSCRKARSGQEMFMRGFVAVAASF